MVGPLDSPMATLTKVLINTFVKTARAWTRNATVFDPTDNTSILTTTNANIVTGPPAPYKDDEIDGESVRTGDIQIVVARLDVDASGFDPFPTQEARVLVNVDGVEYKVIRFENFVSGDLKAAFRFQLRR